MLTEQKLQYLEERRKGIGGSDIGPILGLSPWKSAYQVYQEKRGEVPHWEGNDTTDWGLRMEPTLRQFYSDKTGRAVRVPDKILVHPDHPFMLASLDGLTDCCRVVELKTARFGKGWGEPGTSEIPDYYSTQTQWYLAVTGFPVADVVVSIGGAPAALYEVQEDKELQEMMIEAAAAFWQRVIDGNPPDVVSFSDAVSKFGLSGTAGIVYADAEVVAAVEALRQVKEQKEALEAQEDELKAKCVVALGEAGDALVDTGGRVLVTYKLAKGRETVDSKKLAISYPEAYADCLKIGAPSRRFLLKD